MQDPELDQKPEIIQLLDDRADQWAILLEDDHCKDMMNATTYYVHQFNLNTFQIWKAR